MNEIRKVILENPPEGYEAQTYIDYPEPELTLLRYADDAIAELEKLRAENEALRAKLPQWISVTESPPETGVPVLAITKFGDKAVSVFYTDRKRQAFRAVAFGEDAYRNDDGWPDSASTIESIEVTHWMPLPDAPEQEP